MRKSHLVFLLLLLPVAYMNIPTFRENIHLIEPLLLLTLSVTLLVTGFSPRGLLHTVEKYCLLFFCYAVCRNFFLPAIEYNEIAQCVLICCIYVSLRKGDLFAGRTSYTRIILVGVICCSMIPMAVFLFQKGNLEERVNLLFIPNKSIYGILIAAQTLLMMGFIIVKEEPTIRLSKTVRIFIMVIALLNVCLLIVTQSRSGWLGFAAGILFIAWQLAGRHQWRKLILLIGGSLWTIVVLCLLFYKQGSTSGRLLVYKISWKLFSKYPVFGIGKGRFKINYNLEQADYFAASDGTPKEVLLADNTIYSFCEPLQLLVENGIVGAVILALILIAFVRVCLTALKAGKRNPLLIGAVASLIGIGISSLFSYPIQTLPV